MRSSSSKNSNKRIRTLWQKVTGSSPPSYDRFDGEEEADDKENKSSSCNEKQLPTSESKNFINDSKTTKCGEATPNKKKKRKGWKRIRHAALVTCRYIGFGVSHLSPAPEYSVGDRNMDYCYGLYPSMYCNSKVQPPPHWTTGIILNGW